MTEKEELSVETNSRTARPLKIVSLAGLAAAGGWIFYSSTMIDHNLPLPLAIDSERRLFSSDMAGLLSYYVDDSGDGPPLLLLHSINAAASAYEMRPIFEHYRGRRPVYALDLPGFGFSERSDRYYSPPLYAGAIGDFLTKGIVEPADVIALSLSSEFAAQAAVELSDHVRSLTLISPTGLSADDRKGASDTQTQVGGSTGVLNLLTFPLWSQPFYDLLVTRASIRYFLSKSFSGSVDDGLADYSYLASHQPGARYAPLHFVSGMLFTPNVLHAVYAHVDRPGLLVYDKDPYTAFENLSDLLLSHSSWSAVRITPTQGLPQFEQMEMLARVLDNFWRSVAR